MIVDLDQDYRAYVEKYVANEIKGLSYLRPLFSGWVNDYVYVVILESYKEVHLFFGNIKSKKIYYRMPIYCNEDGYKVVNTSGFKNLPKEFRDVLKARGVPKNGKEHTITTLHRLVGACNYDLTGRDIHHQDHNRTNNHIGNLVPLNPTYHLDHVHRGDYENVSNIVNFDMVKNILAKKVNPSKRKNFTMYNSDLIKYAVCQLRYIHKVKVFDIPQAVSGLISIPPSIRTVEEIVRKFRWFEKYYNQICDKEIKFAVFLI